ncbi:helix-turn-helix transcriptional regulator [Micromonosporaceae bacterium Da 78-11]
MSRDRAELGAFLRSRRDRLKPAEAGIEPFPGPRRVPGLRREELAVLAGVSADYYSRVEQGRQPVVSDEVLDALAGALRLDQVERAHLRDLAGGGGRRRRGAPESPQRADPGLLRVLVALDHLPVLLLGRRAEVLAGNTLLTEVLGRAFTPGDSFIRYLFQDPSARERILNWADFAAAATGALRREAGKHPHDRRLRELIAELRRTDPDVARWWDGFGVQDWTSVTKHIGHPAAGRLSFDIEIVASPREPDQVLVVYTAQPGSATHRMLPLLGSWASHPVAPLT